MKIAEIEIYKNEAGTLSIHDENFNGFVSFPIEMIPTIIKGLKIIYEENNHQSDIKEDEVEHE